MNAGYYKGVAYNGDGRGWWIVGALTAGEFPTLNALRKFVDDNIWSCPRNAGG